MTGVILFVGFAASLVIIFGFCAWREHHYREAVRRHRKAARRPDVDYVKWDPYR